MHLSFRLLGPMEILREGQPIASPAAAERALLVQLLLSPGADDPRHLAGGPAVVGVVAACRSDERAADPGVEASPCPEGRRRRRTWSSGRGPAIARPSRPTAVDAVDFELRVREVRARTAEADTYDELHLRAYDDALALWRGEPLSDFAGEQWATVEAARLTGLRLAALTERAQVALALVDTLEVVARPRAAGRARPHPGVTRRAADGRAVPQRAAGRRARGLHPHPGGPRRASRARALGLLAVACTSGS